MSLMDDLEAYSYYGEHSLSDAVIGKAERVFINDEQEKVTIEGIECHDGHLELSIEVEDRPFFRGIAVTRKEAVKFHEMLSELLFTKVPDNKEVSAVGK
jgi:hypothetical protein